VRIMGESRLATGDVYDPACGYDRPGVWIETEAALLVR
jgi:hypothetical protein